MNKIGVLLLSGLLSIGSFSNAQGPSKGKPILEGAWTIYKFKFAGISAMDEKGALQWVGKKVTITDRIRFEFDKIENYRELFKDEADCFIDSLNNPQYVDAEKYFFDGYRISPKELNINEKEIKLFKTNCRSNPFMEFILTDKNEIIINWDGVFFFLKRNQ